MDNIFDFTMRAENEFYELIEKEDFTDKDAGYIYECLKSRVNVINFCEHLKRYIYRSLYNEEEGHEPDYRGHIMSMFEMNGVPSSMSGSSTKLSAAAANWLTQKRVSRDTIFLLGFGLAMNRPRSAKSATHVPTEKAGTVYSEISVLPREPGAKTLFRVTHLLKQSLKRG